MGISTLEHSALPGLFEENKRGSCLNRPSGPLSVRSASLGGLVVGNICSSHTAISPGNVSFIKATEWKSEKPVLSMWLKLV